MAWILACQSTDPSVMFGGGDPWLGSCVFDGEVANIMLMTVI